MRISSLLFVANIISCCIFHQQCFSQGIVRGKITDKNGESVIGATVVLKNNRSIGTTADFDGNYSLKITDSTPQAIVISFISFKTIEEEVSPKNGQVLVRNYILQSAAQEVKQVEITAKAVKARDYYMEKMKTNSATTLDYVSSETMKKTGDANVTAAVTRVAGVSSNGGFITVRGIGDRYVKTAINGSRIPTLDPFTNNIKLDLFPASLVDNVLITKTAGADLPGDWAGAYLSIETKDYPEQLAVNVESSFGYNNKTTFKDVVSSQRSKTDWLGYDNSFRDHDHSQFQNAILSPSQYDEMIALGLGDYFNALGVNSKNWGEGSATGETYFKMGLVQLGLLPPALFNDPAAVNNAKKLYAAGNYKEQAFNKINAGVDASGKSFPVNWNIEKRKAPLNFSQSLSIGNQRTLFGKPVGFLCGFRYGSNTQSDPNATSFRPKFDRSLSSQLTQENSIETNGWSGLLTVAYKLTSNNSLSFLFMPNFTGTNKVRRSFDRGDIIETATLSQFYEQRKQMVYQFKTENYIPKLKLKTETNVSFTKGKSSAPDFKNLQYWINPDTSYQIGGSIGDGIHRYYRYLSDNILDVRFAGEIPFANKPDRSRKVKFGAAYQRNDKENNQYDYALNLGPKIGAFTNQDVNAYLNANQFDINNGVDDLGNSYNTINAYYVNSSSPADHTFGNSVVYSGYLATDVALSGRLRLSGGVRIEHASIFTDVVKFDSLGLAKNDLRRNYSASYPIANPGELKETNFLPDINLIYKIRNADDAPVNLRLNYSQSVARPSIRELSDVAVLDYELRAPVFGNSDLKSVRIQNYDMRFESYFKSNDNVSLSLFYKDFKNHIELINAGGFTWQNVDKSTVKGIEIEGRKIISRHFEAGANITLVNSNTNYVRTRFELSNGIKTYIPLDTISRTMFGQAPYVLNGILTYRADSIGLIVTASYNVQGARLVIASDNPSIPDVYEMPRNVIDIKISKRIGRHFGISLTVRDLLNTPIRRSYKYEEGFNVLDYDKYTYGTNYILSFSYKL
jgi:hypothetical protein